MILLSNGHVLERVIPSGALGFGVKGWWWERPLVWLGFIQPELFTVFIRTLTKDPRLYPTSNLSWIRPWTWLPMSPFSCVRLIDDGSVNKINFWNPGFDAWAESIAPGIDFQKYAVGGSIYGKGSELVQMAEKFNRFDIKALEVNDSCPNTGRGLEQAFTVIENVKNVKKVSRHPIIVKVSVAQDYLAIADGLAGVAEAISLNSVPWEMVFPGQQSPLIKLEQRLGGGGGGVSGKPAQRHNWMAVEALAKQGKIPVIASSIMEFEDIAYVIDHLGAKAWSAGAIHLPSHRFWLHPWTLFTNPCKPTSFVLREKKPRFAPKPELFVG